MENAEVWACGGGTQSGAIAALIAQGKLPAPHIAYMIDTQREKSGTWPFVEGFIRPMLAKANVDLAIVPKDRFATVDLFGSNGQALMPGWTNITGQVGQLEPFCSGEWKRDVGSRYLRSIGIESATVSLGISLDEMRRVRTPRRKWLQLAYPLIFTVPMRRSQCVAIIRAEGWTGDIPRSACFMCPNQGDAEWIDMKLNYPADFAKACAVESEIRLKDPHFYLHPSCVTLDQVDFFAQGTMFAERGCTMGCFT